MINYILIFSFFLCSQVNSYEETPVHIVEARRVIREYLTKISKQKKIIFLGWSGALFSNIEELDLDFESMEEKTMDDARKEIVYLTDELIDLINNDLKIREFLKVYPFTTKNLKIAIVYTKNPNLEEVSSFYRIVMMHGKIYYYSRMGIGCLSKENYIDAKSYIEKL